jgi:hypothetical protein
MMTNSNQKIKTFEELMRENINFSKKYRAQSKLVQLIRSEKMSQQRYRQELLDAIQVFSDYFQRVVLLRSSLCEDAVSGVVAQEHLQEEFCHNLSLMADRNYRPKTWDPILDATSAWFCWKMFTLDQEEKTLLIHLVLETSANIFFQEAHKVMSKYHETDYFKIHSIADDKHEKMGRALLEDLSEKKYQKLSELLLHGWDVLNAACNRIAELTESTELNHFLESINA